MTIDPHPPTSQEREVLAAPDLPPNLPAKADIPVENGKTILLNWVIMILGFGAVGLMGVLLPELM